MYIMSNKRAPKAGPKAGQTPGHLDDTGAVLPGFTKPGSRPGLLRVGVGVGLGLLALGLVGGCPSSDEISGPSVVPEAATVRDGGIRPLEPVFIDVDFPTLYQTLLLHGLTEQEKNERWSRFYKQRWIHWTGQLSYIKKDLLLFRQLGTTGTYDVLVRTARAPEQLPAKLTIGRYYTYIGRLDRYDDGFHTLYLDQGVVLDAGLEGVPGFLAMPPETTRKVAGPPIETLYPIPRAPSPAPPVP